MPAAPAIIVSQVSYRYGDRPALQSVDCTVGSGQIFGLLGPNGGGKTTLFRIVSTLIPVQSGSVRVLGLDVAQNPAAVRSRIGVTFQSPSLDRKLTVRENLTHQGHLYGLSGRLLQSRIEALLDRLGLADRVRDRVETLSGGLARRVEIAKGLLHDPPLLLLDEPSTGLDPGARADLWQYLGQLRDQSGTTVLVTTHLMEEAERCDALAILDQGTVVAAGVPEELRAAVGGDCITIDTADPQALAEKISSGLSLAPRVVGRQLRLETPRGHELIGRLIETLGPDISSITLGKPTLDDVFIQRTGHRFWGDGEAGR